MKEERIMLTFKRASSLIKLIELAKTTEASCSSRFFWLNPHSNKLQTNVGYLVAVPIRCITHFPNQRQDEKHKVLPLDVGPVICGTAVSPQEKLVVVSLSDGSENKYPWLWLRDNCQCDRCYSPALHSRTIDWEHFDINITPANISTQDSILGVTWSDGHESTFSLPWLLERGFTPKAQDVWLNEIYKLPRVPWGSADFHKVLRRFSFSHILESDTHLLEWLEWVVTYGLAIVEGTPNRRDQNRRLAERVAFIKKTHYGSACFREEFEVQAKAGASNLAYLATPLQLHSDLLYYEYQPGLNMLHCLVQAAGDEEGKNQFTDCLRLSQILRETQPDVYKMLSTTLVDWSDIGAERGEILTFDNLRMLHGRTGYNNGRSERHLIGVYMDNDMVFSRIRVLREKLRRSPAN
uniref:Gamma-butyrobetaine dioxygenase n=1 Tax=Timema tahoe TaxID=61484 RepID=A0A7R9IRU5_9NEOP|nr:unnamed protein product [Timema tahoe]